MKKPKILERLEIELWKTFVRFLHKPSVAHRSALIGLVVICLVAALGVGGMRSIRRLNRVNPPEPVPIAQVAPVHAHANQQNTLLVLVDSLSASEPRLEGVWLVVRAPGMPHLAFLPVYPGGAPMGIDHTSSASEGWLPALFCLDGKHQLGARFQDSLHSRAIAWRDVLLLDRQALADMVDAAGGIRLDRQVADGSVTLARLPAAHSNPLVALQVQSEIYRQTCQQVAGLLGDPATGNAIEPACEFPTLQPRILAALFAEDPFRR